MKKLEPILILITLLLMAITLWWGLGLLKEEPRIEPTNFSPQYTYPDYDNEGKG